MITTTAQSTLARATFEQKYSRPTGALFNSMTGYYQQGFDELGNDLDEEIELYNEQYRAFVDGWEASK